MSRNPHVSSRRQNQLRRLALEPLEARTLLSGIQIDRYALPTGTVIIDMGPGPDGNVWFLDSQDTGTFNAPKIAYQIGEVAADGTVSPPTPLPTNVVPTANIHPSYGYHQILTTGSDGKLWFVATGSDGLGSSLLESFDPSTKAFTTLALSDSPEHLTSDSTGMLYYSGYDASGVDVGQIDPRTLVSSRHAISPAMGDSIDQVGGLAVAPDGRLWFTAVQESSPQQGVVGVYDPTLTDDTAVQAFVVTNNADGDRTLPTSIVLGPDGNLDFVEGNPGAFNYRLGSIDQKGDLPALTANLLPQGSLNNGLAVGSDGALWTTNGNTGDNGVSFYRVTTTGDVTPVAITQRFNPDYYNLITGPDGNLWFSNYNLNTIQPVVNNQIVRMIVPPSLYNDYTAASGATPDASGYVPAPGSLATLAPAAGHLPVPAGQVFTQTIGDVTPSGEAVVEGTFHVDLNASGNPVLGPNDSVILGIADGASLYQLRVATDPNDSTKVVFGLNLTGSTADLTTVLDNPGTDHTFRLIKHADGSAELKLGDANTFRSVQSSPKAALPTDPKGIGSPGFAFGAAAGVGSPGGASSEWSHVRFAVGTTDPVEHPRFASQGEVTITSSAGRSARTASGPVTVGPGDSVIIEVHDHGHAFPKPDAVDLVLPEGYRIHLALDPEAQSLPAVSNDFFYRQIISPTDAAVFNGNTIGVEIAAKDFDGNPIGFNSASFVIGTSSLPSEAKPKLSIVGLQPVLADSSVALYSVETNPGQTRVLEVDAGPPAGAGSVKLFPIDAVPRNLQIFLDPGLTDPFSTAVSITTAKLYLKYTPDRYDTLSSLQLYAYDTTTHLSSFLYLDLSVAGDAAPFPQLTVRTSPLAAPPVPGTTTTAFQVHIDGDVPLSNVTVTVSDAQGNQQKVAADEINDGTRLHWLARIAFVDATQGLLDVRVRAINADDPRHASNTADTKFFAATPGTLIRQAAQALSADPLLFGTSLTPPADGAPFLYRDSDNALVEGHYSVAAQGIIAAGAGNSIIAAGAGGIIAAGAGNTIVAPGAGNSIIAAGAGNSIIAAGAGNSIIAAGAGNSIVGAGAGNTIIAAGAGNSIGVFNIASIIAAGAGGIVGAGAGNTLLYAMPGALPRSGDPVSVGGNGQSFNITAQGDGLSPSSIEINGIRANSIIAAGAGGIVGAGAGNTLLAANNLIAGVGANLQGLADSNVRQALDFQAGGSFRAGSRAAGGRTPSGVAPSVGGAVLDAILNATYLAQDRPFLPASGASAADIASRNAAIAADLDAAATLADSGFSALSATQLAALRRSGHLINLTIAPLVAGQPITPGSSIAITPTDPTDTIAPGVFSSANGSFSLGGTVVTLGGTTPPPVQPGAPYVPAPLNGSVLPLFSASSGRIVAGLSGLTKIGNDQVLILTTADGRLAIGHFAVAAGTGSIQFGAPTYTWGAKGKEAQVLVTRTGGSTGAIGVFLTASDGSGKAGVDYKPVSVPVTFGDGDVASRLITIPVLDSGGSVAKTVNLALVQPFNGAALGTQAAAVLTIQPNLGTIAGTVFVDANGDGTHQSGETGSANVAVYLDANGNGKLDPGETLTASGPDGSYLLGGLSAGSYNVRIVAPSGATPTGLAQHPATIDGSGALISGGDFGLVVAMPVAISGVPANQVVEATGPGGAIVTYTMPTASDGLNANLPVTTDHPSGATFSIGTTTVTFSASDGQTSASASFGVTVRDTTAPTISGVSANRTVAATSAAGAVVSFDSPTATDLVDPHPTIVSVPASGSVFPVGTTTVVVTATDHSGNARSTSFTVSVTAPVIALPTFTSLPANQTDAATSAAGAVVTFANPTVHDDADPNPTITCSPASGSVFPVGATTVTCTATDHLGKTITATFVVTVAPFIPPPDGPKVMSAQEQSKFSKYVLAFDGALDASRAGNKANYAVSYTMKVGKKTKIVKTVIKSATYDPVAHLVTLVLKKKPSGATSAQVSITGTGPAGVAGSNGLLLDGDRDGTPGGNQTITLRTPATVTAFGLAHPRGLHDLGGPVFGTRRARP